MSFDPGQWRLQASSTPEGQAEINRQRAAMLIAQPLTMALYLLLQGGYLAAGETLTIPVRTPTQTITVTFAVSEHSGGGQ